MAKQTRQNQKILNEEYNSLDQQASLWRKINAEKEKGLQYDERALKYFEKTYGSVTNLEKRIDSIFDTWSDFTDEVEQSNKKIKETLNNFTILLEKNNAHIVNFEVIKIDNPSKLNRPPMANHYLALGNALNSPQEIDVSYPVDPKLNVSILAKQSISIKLQVASIPDKSIYVLCPGAEYGITKRWPTEHFTNLAKQLISNEPNTHVILLGSKGDHILGEGITAQAKNISQIHNWCGKTSLDEAIALIGMSKVLVSNDSGLMHIGAALKIPQVAIFGSSDPHHTPPLSDKAKVIWLNLPCSPCHKRECPLGHLKCLKDISPATVLSAVQILR
jgi:lipopolysaccharide heptosyltransferase II